MPVVNGPHIVLPQARFAQDCQNTLSLLPPLGGTIHYIILDTSLTIEGFLHQICFWKDLSLMYPWT